MALPKGLCKRNNRLSLSFERLNAGAKKTKMEELEDQTEMLISKLDATEVKLEMALEHANALEAKLKETRKDTTLVAWIRSWPDVLAAIIKQLDLSDLESKNLREHGMKLKAESSMMTEAREQLGSIDNPILKLPQVKQVIDVVVASQQLMTQSNTTEGDRLVEDADVILTGNSHIRQFFASRPQNSQ